MSVQYEAIFKSGKNDIFRWKNVTFFLIFAQNIDCGYPQSMFKSKNKNKKNYNMILSCYNYGRVTIIYDAIVNY